MPHRVTWIRIGDFYPDLKAEQDHFLALDGMSAVGIVRLIESGESGSDSGRWHWSMVQARPGKPFSRPRSGTRATRSQAARAVVECWRAFRRHYGIEER